jgi:hypothetical protein
MRWRINREVVGTREKGALDWEASLGEGCFQSGKDLWF